MARFLVYWRTFWNDYGPDGARAFVLERGYGSARLKEARPGDVVWVTVTNRHQGTEWRLAQRIQILDVYRDGYKWRARADPERSIFLALDRQRNFEQILTRLTFGTGKRIKATGALIGRLIQSVRRLAPSDVELLTSYLRLYVQRPISIDPDLETTRRRMLSINQIYRNPNNVKQVKDFYGDHCQVCGDAIRLPGGRTYSEAHHIRPLGHPHDGPDEVENMLCVCPNCHVRLDYRAIDLNVSKLKIHQRHNLSHTQITYHNDLRSREIAEDDIAASTAG
jgi:5-methylcytosine-specific restriction endonuclease McrA